MLSRIIVYAILMTRWNYFIKCRCEDTVAEKPMFGKTMKEHTATLSGQKTGIDCCMYGVSKIMWSFSKNLSMSEWQIIDNRTQMYRFTVDNRTMDIIKARRPEDTGCYRCNGTNDSGESLSGETCVLVGAGPKDRSIRIENASDVDILNSEIGSTVTLFCVSTMEIAYTPYFKWNRVTKGRSEPIISRKNLTIKDNKSTLVYGYQGFSNVTKRDFQSHEYIYNLTMTICALQSWHEGEYSCEVEDSGKDITNQTARKFFKIVMARNGNHNEYELIGLIGCLIALVTIVLVFKYEIKVQIQRTLRASIFRHHLFGRYNFFIIYNFDHSDEFKFVFKVVQDLESRHLSSYFYHRDQTYGKDIHEDLNTALRSSNVIVIWTSPWLWYNPTSNFCIQMSLNHCSDIKRVYIISADKKQIIKHCNTKTVNAELDGFMTSKLFCLDPSIIDMDSQSSILKRWRYSRFLIWLESCLPMKYAPSQETTKMSYVNETYS